MTWRVFPALVSGVGIPLAFVPALADAVGPGGLTGLLGIVMILTALSIAVAERMTPRSGRPSDGDGARA